MPATDHKLGLHVWYDFLRQRCASLTKYRVNHLNRGAVITTAQQKDTVKYKANPCSTTVDTLRWSFTNTQNTLCLVYSHSLEFASHSVTGKELNILHTVINTYFSRNLSIPYRLCQERYDYIILGNNYIVLSDGFANWPTICRFPFHPPLNDSGNPSSGTVDIPGTL